MSSNSLLAFALGVALTAAALPVAAPRAQDQGMPEDMKKMFEQAKKFTEPGEMHKKLAAFIGKWDCTTSMFMAPDAPPMTSKSKAEIRWLLEGRVLQQEQEGELMGMRLHSFDFTGYDNFKQAFVKAHVDSMNTYLLTAQGLLAQDGKTMIFYGTLDEYLTGENDKMVKSVYRWQDADHFTYEVHDLAIGEEHTKVFEISYSRAK